MAMNGTDILLLVNTGTVLIPVYEVVGSQRDVSFEETDAGVDYSSKDSRAQRVGCGRYASTLSLDALYVPTDAAYQQIQNAIRNGTLIQVLRQEGGVSLETASARVDKLGAAGPDQAEATVSIDLTIDGEWTEVGT